MGRRLWHSRVLGQSNRRDCGSLVAKLVSSLAYDDIFKKFFNGAYAAAGI
jgi:hypothetical protein